MDKQFFINLADKLRWIDQIVSGVWVVLSILMFISAWIIYREKGTNREFWLVVVLIGATWTYPLYTFGFKLIPGLIGNVLYIAFTLFVITQVRNVSINASYLLYPLVAWVGFASIYVVFQLLSR